MEQQVKCEFLNIYEDIYTCTIENQEIGSKSILKFVGNHIPGKGNNDVLEISLNNCKLRDFPKELTRIFPNLQHLQIFKSELKNISREHLKEYKNLKALRLSSNEIAYLSGDLLEDLKELKSFIASNSKIEIIDPKIFEKCKNLKHINLKGNICIDKCFNLLHPSSQNATLKEIKEELEKNYPSWGDKVKNFKGEITSEVLKLIKEFSKKEEKLQNSDRKIEELEKKLSEMKLKFEDYENVMKTEELKDITIKAESKEFKAHKFVLAAHSSTLAKLISENVHAESLNLLHVSTNAFRTILDFMYANEFSENNQINFTELFIASEMLKIERLKKIAAEKLLDEINSPPK